MTKSLPAPCPDSNVRPGPLDSYRLCVSLVGETRAELALFAARATEFQVEIDAMPRDKHGLESVSDFDSVVYDITGLAEMLILVGDNLLDDGKLTRVYAPIAAPVGYCDALAMIVARVEALRKRLETHLHALDESEFDTTGEQQADGTEPVWLRSSAWLRAAAWAAWQAMDGTEGGVQYGLKEVAESLLATAVTAEAAAWDNAESDDAEAAEAAAAGGVGYGLKESAAAPLADAVTDDAAGGQTRPEPRASDDEAGEALTLSRVLARLADAVAAGPALLLGERAAAALCGVGVTTFRRRVAAGVLPRQVALCDGLALWRRKDIERAVDRLKGRDETRRAKTRRAKAEAREAT